MLTRFLTAITVLTAALTLGCAQNNNSPKSQQAAPDETPLSHLAPQQRVAASSEAWGWLQPQESTQSHRQKPTEPTGQITLREAIAYALVNSPHLRAFSWDIHFAEANQMQAALRPNPKIEVQVEEFGGTGDTRQFKSSEASLQVGQLIELAGKRSKRINLATLEKQLAQWDYRAKRLDVISHVAAAFIDTLEAQEKLALSKELLRLTEQTHTAVAQRVNAGKDSPLKETKAKIALSTMQIQAKAAAQALKSAKMSLAATWGANQPLFDIVRGQFYQAPPVPDFKDLAARIENNPDIARWPTEKQKYRAAFDLEKAKAKSDPTIRGGVKQLSEGDNTAFIVGLSIPIPIHDRNQAGIRRATYAIEKAAEQQRQAEINIHKNLAQAAQNLATAFTEATILDSDIVPGAQRAFDAATQGYQAGKFDYLDVLDAQRTLFEAKGKYIRSLAEYHKAKINVERLIAKSLDSTKDTQEETK